MVSAKGVDLALKLLVLASIALEDLLLVLHAKEEVRLDVAVARVV